MRKMMLVVAGFVLVLMAATVWPSRYRHDQMRSGQTTVLIRTDRFTGEAQYFDARTGWTTAQTRPAGVSQKTMDLLTAPQ